MVSVLLKEVEPSKPSFGSQSWSLSAEHQLQQPTEVKQHDCSSLQDQPCSYSDLQGPFPMPLQSPTGVGASLSSSENDSPKM